MQPRPIGWTVNGPSLRFAPMTDSLPGSGRRGNRESRRNAVEFSRRETWLLHRLARYRFCLFSIECISGRMQMPDFAFGGPRGGIIQMAYTVADIRAAIDHWISDLKVGPWFLLD